MHKITSFLRKIPLKIYILFFIVFLIIIPSVNFLNSIHYKLNSYFIWDYQEIQNFGEHKEAFETLVNDIENFVNITPDFNNEFDRLFTIKDNSSLSFTRKGKTPKDSDWEYDYDLEDADKIRNFTEVFPDDFRFAFIYIDSNYPGYVMFRSDETTSRVLVYTGGEKPSKLINSYWEKFKFVRVHKVAKGWYDISPEKLK